MRIRSERSSQSTPFRIGRLSSVLAANATWPISFWRSLAAIFQPPSNLTLGKAGNSSRERPRSLNLDLPHSMVTRCSPELVIRMAALGSSRTISTSLRAGRVMAPSWSTEAGIVVLTAMSRSVPESRSPSLDASTRMLASTGSVVLVGHAGGNGQQTFVQLFPRDGELHPSLPRRAK